jgi:hypothetical protein
MISDDIEFIYIGWCNRVKNGTVNDKVWTAFKAGDCFYAGWGARGKTIRFKKHYDQWALKEVMYKKQKDYVEVDAFTLFSMLPDFENQVKSKLTFDILTDSVMPTI